MILQPPTPKGGFLLPHLRTLSRGLAVPFLPPTEGGERGGGVFPVRDLLNGVLKLVSGVV